MTRWEDSVQEELRELRKDVKSLLAFRAWILGAVTATSALVSTIVTLMSLKLGAK